MNGVRRFRNKKNAVAVDCLSPHSSFNLTCASNERSVISHKSARPRGVAIVELIKIMRRSHEELEAAETRVSNTKVFLAKLVKKLVSGRFREKLK